MTFTRDEVESEFQRWWKLGNVDENWAAWVELFTPDVYYIDHFWGPLHGRAEVALWIDAVMKGVPEIYGVLDWYAIDGERVVFRIFNRRDNPSDEGPPYFDFPGLSVLTYAGDGLWSSEEDYWDRDGRPPHRGRVRRRVRTRRRHSARAERLTRPPLARRTGLGSHGRTTPPVVDARRRPPPGRPPQRAASPPHHPPLTTLERPRPEPAVRVRPNGRTLTARTLREPNWRSDCARTGAVRPPVRGRGASEWAFKMGVLWFRRRSRERGPG